MYSERGHVCKVPVPNVARTELFMDLQDRINLAVQGMEKPAVGERVLRELRASVFMRSPKPDQGETLPFFEQLRNMLAFQEEFRKVVMERSRRTHEVVQLQAQASTCVC